MSFAENERETSLGRHVLRGALGAGPHGGLEAWTAEARSLGVKGMSS